MDINLDMAELKPSFWNLVLVFLAVLITVPFAKWFFNTVEVPGVTNLVNSI